MKLKDLTITMIVITTDDNYEFTLKTTDFFGISGFLLYINYITDIISIQTCIGESSPFTTISAASL